MEKVWKKSEKLGSESYTVIIHGKHRHEETRATFSHSTANAPSLIIKDMDEARVVGDYILGGLALETFLNKFDGRYSAGFSPVQHLERVGVVNQTTMLATETQEIAEFFKSVMEKKYGATELRNHFADTRDTLCYATNDNQQATYGLLTIPADFAIVVGGYNSSNTSHIVELCEQKLPTYFISGIDNIRKDRSIEHYDYHRKLNLETREFIPVNTPVSVIVTSGASCPDALIDGVLDRLLEFFGNVRSKEEVLHSLSV